MTDGATSGEGQMAGPACVDSINNLIATPAVFLGRVRNGLQGML